jgi:uncharacterized protein
VLIALGCGRDEAPPPRAAPMQQTAPSGGSLQNRAMGTGEARDPQPFTLEQRLLDAVRRGDRPTIERALELGATVQAKDDLARSTVLLATKDAGDLELVRWLRAKGAPVDEPDVGGRTALSFAAEAGRLDIVRELVDDGAADDRRDGQQRAPLFHAVLGAHDGVVAFLLDRGADVNARDQFGDTPLMMACAKGFASTAALLLQHGADPSIKDQEGRTAKERSAAGVEPCLGSPAR